MSNTSFTPPTPPPETTMSHRRGSALGAGGVPPSIPRHSAESPHKKGKQRLACMATGVYSSGAMSQTMTFPEDVWTGDRSQSQYSSSSSYTQSSYTQSSYASDGGYNSQQGG